MTVQELIARLSELPPDAIPFVRDQDGELLSVDDADVMHGRWTDGKPHVYITGNY